MRAFIEQMLANFRNFIHTKWVRWQYPYVVHYRATYELDSNLSCEIQDWLEKHVGHLNGKIMTRVYDTYDVETFGGTALSVKRIRAIRFKDKDIAIQFKLTFADRLTG